MGETGTILYVVCSSLRWQPPAGLSGITPRIFTFPFEGLTQPYVYLHGPLLTTYSLDMRIKRKLPRKEKSYGNTWKSLLSQAGLVLHPFFHTRRRYPDLIGLRLQY